MIKKLSIVTHKIRCKNAILELTNQRVIYWEAQESLILSDLHIGKAAHFQKSGIPIPSSVLTTDLERLAHLIHHFNAKQLIIVGDLFHASYNKDLDVFKTWLGNFSDLKSEGKLPVAVFAVVKRGLEIPAFSLGEISRPQKNKT